MTMKKIDGLPYGAYTTAQKNLRQRGLVFSQSLIAAVANGKRQNVLIEEELLKIRRQYRAMQRRTHRLRKTDQ